MTTEQRHKIQQAIQALIEVEAALHEGTPPEEAASELRDLHRKLRDARTALADLNAPNYT